MEAYSGSHKFLRLVRQEKAAANRIKKIAADFGQPLGTAFELGDLPFLSEDLLAKVVAQLLATRSTKLRREEEELEILLLPAFDIWLATWPKTIDLSPLLSFCPRELKYHYFKKLIILISQKAPDIQELALICTENRFEVSNFIYCTADSELLEALGKLKRLQSLRIEEICNFQLMDIIELCQNLPELEVLKVNTDHDFQNLDFEAMDVAEKMKNAMSNLKVFLFDFVGDSFIDSLINFCAQHLKNLKVIGDFSDGFDSWDIKEMLDEKESPPAGVSNLRHLLLNFEVSLGPTFGDATLASLNSFPMIKHLWIDFWPDDGLEENDVAKLFELNNLESLQVIGVPVNIVRRLLSKFGKNLRNLKVKSGAFGDGEYPINLSFSDIFALCPKLERLWLSVTVLEDPNPISSFSELKEISLDMYRFLNNRIKLSDLLRAPNLEKITLDGRYIDLDDLKKLTLMIAEKKVLKNLQSVNFLNEVNSLQYVDAKYFKVVSDFIKCAVASIPGLKVVMLHLHYLKVGYAALAKSMRNGITVNEQVPPITQFFEGLNTDNECYNFFVDEELIDILDKHQQ